MKQLADRAMYDGRIEVLRDGGFFGQPLTVDLKGTKGEATLEHWRGQNRKEMYRIAFPRGTARIIEGPKWNYEITDGGNSVLVSLPDVGTDIIGQGFLLPEAVSPILYAKVPVTARLGANACHGALDCREVSLFVSRAVPHGYAVKEGGNLVVGDPMSDDPGAERAFRFGPLRNGWPETVTYTERTSQGPLLRAAWTLRKVEKGVMTEFSPHAYLKKDAVVELQKGLVHSAFPGLKLDDPGMWARFDQNQAAWAADFAKERQTTGNDLTLIGALLLAGAVLVIIVGTLLSRRKRSGGPAAENSGAGGAHGS